MGLGHSVVTEVIAGRQLKILGLELISRAPRPPALTSNNSDMSSGTKVIPGQPIKTLEAGVFELSLLISESFHLSALAQTSVSYSGLDFRPE